jgi:hypothetical protein
LSVALGNLGQVALPIVIDAWNSFREPMRQVGMFMLTVVLPAFTQFTAYLTRHTEAVKIAATGIGVMVVAWKAYRIVQMLATAAMAAFNVVARANPIGIVVTAIAGLVAAFVVAYRHSARFREIVQQVWAQVKVFAAAVVAAWPQIQQVIIRAWNAIQPTLLAWWKLLLTVWNQIIKPLVAWIVAHWPQISAVMKVVFTIVGALLFVFIKEIQLVATILRWFVQNIAGPLFRTFLAVTSAVITAVIGVWRGLQTAWSAVFNTIRTVGGQIIDWFRALPGRVAAAVSGIFGAAVNWGARIISSIVSGLGSAVGSVVNWFKDLPGKILSALGIASPPAWAISAGKWIVTGVLKGAGSVGGHLVKFFGSLAGKAWQGILKLPSFIGKLASSIAGGFVPQPGQTGAGGASGSLASWITSAELITGTPLSWGAAIQRRIMFESGGNPNAINLWDSNAMAGDPSRGLMQTIGSTFNAYHQPGTSSNIYDPVANIAAALNYIKSRYGTIFAIDPPVQGYATGAWNIPRDQLAFLHSGEMVIPSRSADKFRGGGGGVTVMPGAVTVYAATGQNERAIADQAFAMLRMWVADEQRRAAKGGRA